MREERMENGNTFLLLTLETILQWENTQTAQHKQLCFNRGTLQYPLETSG